MTKVAADPLVVEGERRVAALRMQLLSLYPFWGYLLAEVQVLWNSDLPTLAATDGLRRIWLNPKWIAHLNRKQLGFVLLHEVGHIVLETIGRQETRNRRLWNRATDYAINRQVAQIATRGDAAKLAWMPPTAIPDLGPCAPLLDPRFDHLPAEAIYERLQKLESSDPGDDPGEPLADGQGQTLRSHPDHGGGIDLHVPQSGDGDAQRTERDQATQRLHRAIDAAQQDDRGANLPLGVDRWLAQSQPPKVAWQALLQRYLNDFGASIERSWARPHRRWLAQGYLVAGAVPERYGVVVLAVDTSGSMQQAQLQAIAAELAVLDDLIGELWVVCADAAVQEVVPPGKLGPYLQRQRFKGGGGTDHRPVFEWLAERKMRPDLLICCTDLFTQLPKRGPSYPVLWLGLPDQYRRLGPRPGFGQLVVVVVRAGG